MRDILVFMSDQHNGAVMGCAGDSVVRTPNMDALAEDGVFFESAYTSCPLCVPARMSMLSGKFSSQTGIFTNTGCIPEEMPTYLHLLANAGYETVLCGRMHFEGYDQRHGFTKRIAQDVTPTIMGCDIKDRGQMGMLQGEPYALQIVGGGNSHIQHYDRYVTDAALKYLAEPHEKPQCIFVGTYSPHSPYVAPLDLYEYYLDQVVLPPNVKEDIHPAEASRKREYDPEVLRALCAAYYGSTEFTDDLMGQVKNAWDDYLKRNDRQGVFVYLSDHGDNCGARGLWAKQSLYESSVHIPMIMAGDGLPKNRRVSEAVSILDLGPTLCSVAGVEESLPGQEGEDLLPVLGGEKKREKPVISEWITNPFFNGTDFGRMVLKDGLKLITYNTHPEADELYRVKDDPWEMRNLAEEEPEKAAELHDIAYAGIDPEEIVRRKNERETAAAIVKKFRRQQGFQNTETWEPTAEQRRKPEKYVSTKTPLIPPMQRAWDRGSWAE